MYGQLSRSVQICSECLSRRLWLGPAIPTWTRSQGSRFQSTAPQPEDIETHQETSGSNHENKLNPNQKRSSFRYRHWKPPEARNLGVDALGKPAEVLILPSRERRLLDVPLLDVESQRPAKYALLDGDSTPLSWEEIQNNLLTVRDTIVRSGDVSMPPDQWKELKRVVTKSFTRDQLKKYLLENSNDAEAMEKGLEAATKRNITAQIMVSVWNLKIAEDQPTLESSDAAPASAHQPTGKAIATEHLAVNKAALDVALVGESRIIRDISEQHHVQIDVFRDRSKVALTGDPENVRLARRKLAQHLKRSPFQRAIEMTDFLRLLTRTPSFDGYAKALMQRFSARIIRQSNRLLISTFNKLSLDSIQRELTHIARSAYRNVGYSLLPTDSPAALAKRRQYPSKLSDWVAQQQLWFRQILENSDQTTKSKVGIEKDWTATCENARQRLIDSKLPSIEQLRHVLSYRPASFRHELRADIGQALSNADQAVPTMLQSAFVTELPLLPQFLHSEAAGLDVKSQEQTIHIRLVPCEDNIKLPAFMICMTGDDFSQGLQQSLKLTKVTACFGSAIHDILLPAEHHDVRLAKSANLMLFKSASHSPLPRHAPLLKSFAAIVQDIQTQGENLETSVHELDLLPLFKESPKLVSTKSIPESNDKSSTTQLSDEVLQVLAIIKKQKSEPLKAAYFIEAPEHLDTTTYTTRAHPLIEIEHIISGPLLDNGIGQRQSIQIMPQDCADSSAGDRNESEVDMLEPVAKAAVEFARKLTEFSNNFGDRVGTK